MTYLESLKRALTGSTRTPLVMVCNFEVEQQWTTDFPGLPAPPFSMTGGLVSRMEELGALLAGPGDHLVLQHPLDDDFVAYVDSVGLELPTVLVTAAGDADAERQVVPTAARALADPDLLARLRQLGERGAALVPMGLSAWEARLGERAGLPVATPALDTVVAVNSKVYSRRLVEAGGLRAVPGWCCETVQQFAELMTTVGPGCTPDAPLVVKDAYGVSGKGLVLLDDPRKAERVVGQVRRRADRRHDDRLYVVVETWLPKRCDLNYQLTVDTTGAIRLDFVKEALTANGVHRGHLSPAALDHGQYAEIERATEVVGKALHADGFWGVVGVDAVVHADGTVYPVLEINARFNMSTYQGRVLETLGERLPASLAGHHVLRLTRPLRFGDVRQALGPLLDLDPSDGGVVITCFGTVNAMASADEPFDGRLYFLALGPDRATASAHADAARAALSALAEGTDASSTTGGEA